ncbi:tRNA-modifying protein YgfZ [Candidatus Ecksteinia adelgidicola]|nr:tRNA-modifying protein YgfZ [Candidatus Ecksteinia adelgidicola]
MSYVPFSSHCLSDLSSVELALILLEDWALVTLSGIDSKKYLQSQITNDIESLLSHQYMICGHCNEDGKIWSNLCLFHRENGFSYLQRRSVLDIQVKAMKKYILCSDVTINIHNDIILLGIDGVLARSTLKRIFNVVPNSNFPVLQKGNTTLLQWTQPHERFLIITTLNIFNKLFAMLHKQAQLYNSRQWLMMDIEAGYPIIDIPNITQFFPQAINLQLLQGINFKKGCYIGQEMVARAQFRGANKRSLYFLEGQSRREPLVSENLEIKLDKDWRRTGTVLASSMFSNGKLLVQAVMNNNIDVNSTLRVYKDITSQLKIKTLPYML